MSALPGGKTLGLPSGPEQHTAGRTQRANTAATALFSIITLFSQGKEKTLNVPSS